MKQQPFVYATMPVVLSPKGRATLTVSITREGAFFCKRVRLWSQNDAAVSIRDSTDDRQWTNIALHSDLLNSWKLSPTRFVAAGGVITIEVVNLSPLENEVRLGFYGHKDYREKYRMPLSSDES